MVETKSKKKIAIVVVAITIAVIGIIVVLCVILDGNGKSETNIDMELYDNAGAEISEFLSDEKFKELSLEEKCEYAIEQLKSTEGIDPDSVFAGEQEYVFFKYTDGAHGMITLEEQNEFMIGSGDTIEIRLNGSANAKTAKVCEISTPDFGNMQTDEIYENGKPKVLMLDAFSDSGSDTNFTKFSNAWSNAHIDCTYDSDVTLDELATKMTDYDMTVILMHGGYSKEHADSLPTVSDPHLIFTHEESSLDVTMKYWNQIITGSIILNSGSNGKTTYVVTGDFFEYYYGKTGVLKDKIIFFGSCRSHYMGDQMMKAMGAKAVIGPTESVSNIYFYSILNDMMYGLMSGKNVGESLDLSESINGAHQAEYIEKFYVEIFGREFSAETMQEDFQNSGMTQKDYDDLIKLLSSFHGKNPEFRLCGDTDATLVTLKSEAKTYLDEHIGSETKPEEETTEPEEKDKTALLLSAVLNNEEVWKPASDMMYYEGQTLWFQDLDFDGINELIVGGYGGGSNRLEYYNVYSLYDDTISANQFQLDCYVQQPLLKLCKYDNSEEYFYINTKAVNSGTGIGMYYELNKYSDLYLSTVAGNYEPDAKTEDNYKYWLNSDHEEITEAEYAEIYNSFIKNLTEYSYTTDKINLSDYDNMTHDEKYERLKKSYDSFIVGEKIGVFDLYQPSTAVQTEHSTTTTASDKNTSTSTTSKVKYYTMNDFSEGCAWVYFKDGDKCYYGCIDKSGKMIFKKDATNILEVSEFKKGYAHIKYKNAYAVIDKQGNELSRYVIGTNTTVRAYGEGYILVQEYKAGFDFSGYTYTIYDGLGKVITTWNNKKEIGGNIKYMGEGVFSFYAQDQGYYCCKSNKWVDYEGKLQQYFNDEYVIIDFHYGDYRVESRATMYLMDSLGNIKEVALSDEIGWDWGRSSSAFNDGVCVLHQTSNDDYLVAYDSHNNTFTTMSNYFAQRVDWDKFTEDGCLNAFIGERMLVPLIGDDGVEYVVLFDKNWNAVADPICANGYLFSGDRLIAYQSHYSASSLSIVVDDVTVYDENCNRLFDMSDIGFSGYQMNGYSDGVAKIVKNGTTKYIDKNGKLLFTEIDMSTAILK